MGIDKTLKENYSFDLSSILRRFATNVLTHQLRNHFGKNAESHHNVPRTIFITINDNTTTVNLKNYFLSTDHKRNVQKNRISNKLSRLAPKNRASSPPERAMASMLL